jgi:hypothetical protein
MDIPGRDADDSEPLRPQQELDRRILLSLAEQHIATEDDDDAGQQHAQCPRDRGVPILQGNIGEQRERDDHDRRGEQAVQLEEQISEQGHPFHNTRPE